MSVQYFEPIMDKIEKEKYKSFVGYINPREQLIDYSTLIGYQTHYSTKNPASMLFLRFVSFLVKGYSPDELKYSWDEEQRLYKDNKTEGYDYVIKRGYDYFTEYNICSYDEFLQEIDEYYEVRQGIIKNQINSTYHSFWDLHVYENLLNDLMIFFKDAYKNEDFFKAIGATLQVQCFDNYLENHENELKYKKKYYTWLNAYDDRDFYNDYVIAELMSYFKDIMVQYLGYDSIERRIKLNPSKSDLFKTITTSCINPNERFYNWLLMDWNIQRIPRMHWKEEEKMFVKENPILSLYQTEKEEILGMEIVSIRKEVP